MSHSNFDPRHHAVLEEGAKLIVEDRQTILETAQSRYSIDENKCLIEVLLRDQAEREASRKPFVLKEKRHDGRELRGTAEILEWLRLRGDYPSLDTSRAPEELNAETILAQIQEERTTTIAEAVAIDDKAIHDDLLTMTSIMREEIRDCAEVVDDRDDWEIEGLIIDENCEDPDQIDHKAASDRNVYLTHLIEEADTRASSLQPLSTQNVTTRKQLANLRSMVDMATLHVFHGMEESGGISLDCFDSDLPDDDVETLINAVRKTVEEKLQRFIRNGELEAYVCPHTLKSMAVNALEESHERDARIVTATFKRTDDHPFNLQDLSGSRSEVIQIAPKELVMSWKENVLTEVEPGQTRYNHLEVIKNSRHAGYESKDLRAKRKRIIKDRIQAFQEANELCQSYIDETNLDGHVISDALFFRSW